MSSRTSYRLGWLGSPGFIVVAALAVAMLVLAATTGSGPTPRPAHAQGTPSCLAPVDVMLVLDSSDSLSNSDVANLKVAAHSFVDTLMPDGSSLARIGVVDYDTTVQSVLGLTGVAGVATIDGAIDAVGHTGVTEYTATGPAIDAAQGQFSNNGVPHVMVIITDGLPNRPEGNGPGAANAAAAAARAAGTEIYVVGVMSSGQGGGFDQDLINGLASDPDAQHAFMISNYSGLQSILQSLGSEICRPNISIEKTLTSAGTATVGDPVTFKLTVRNEGDTTLSNVAIQDEWDDDYLAPANPFVSNVTGVGGISCGSEEAGNSPGHSLVNCTANNLAPGEHVSFTLNFTAVAAVHAAENCAVADAYSAASQTNHESGPSCAAVKIQPPPEPTVSIDKRVNGVDGPITVTEGDTVTYSWTVTNTGDVPLTGVWVDDDTHDVLDGTGNCPATLEPGESCSGSADVTLNDVGTVTNYMVVWTNQEVGNNDTATVYVEEKPEPSVSIDKRVNGVDVAITVTEGDTVTYSWTVTNTGNVPLTGIWVDDDTHDVLDGTGNCPASLDPGASCSGSADVTLNSVGTVTNYMVVWTNQEVGDNDTATVHVQEAPAPAVHIDKRVNGVDGPITVGVGDLVNYTWVVTNIGNVALTDISVDDDTHDGLDGTGDCPAVLEPGESCSGQSNVSLLVAGTVTNVITATAQWEDETVSDTDGVTVYVQSPQPPTQPTPQPSPEPTESPEPPVLGAVIGIDNERITDSPAFIGETVIFNIPVTLEEVPDVTTAVVFVEYDAGFLDFQQATQDGSALAFCVDAAPGLVRCDFGNQAANFSFHAHFEALAVTESTATDASLQADFDADGPGAPGMAGPATADVAIVDDPGLPDVGDGSTLEQREGSVTGSAVAVLVLGVVIAATVTGGGLFAQHRSRSGDER